MNENIALIESIIPIRKIGREKLSAIKGAIGSIIENPMISIKTAIHNGDKLRYLNIVIVIFMPILYLNGTERSRKLKNQIIY
ncbi:MAG: hypothetical protein ACFFB6_11315 [Promethearchaeota archaeon]